MATRECTRCGTALPRKAHFCRNCGATIQKLRGIVARAIAAVAWMLMGGFWVGCGVVMSVAGAEDWKGVEAGFLFSILLLAGLVMIGVKNQTSNS
jgi:hypothetical protein